VSPDKPPGSGDQHPDQGREHKPEDKPFPGQPENRPPAPRPTGYRSFEEISAERAGRTRNKESGEHGTPRPADHAAPGPAAARDTTANAKEPAGSDSGTTGTGPRGTPAVPGTRATDGAVPGNAPARSEGAGPESPASQDRGAGRPDRDLAGRPDAPGGQRPDSLRGTGHTRLRPFPGQPENRPLAPRPTGYRSFEEISTERARGKTAADRNPAKPAEQAAPGQDTAKNAGSTMKEAPAAKPGTTAERSASPREQGHSGSDRAGEATAPARENSAPADKTSAGQENRREPGGDEHPGPPAQPDKVPPAGHNAQESTRTPDGHQPPGSGNPPHIPDASGARGDGKSGLLHGHAEFHGQKIDLYTDGTRWVGGDAVRAAQAETERARTDGRPAPQRHDIASIPQMRDLGRNTVGEKPDRSPGDTSDLPPSGEDLVEEADKGRPRLERLKNTTYREIGDINDSASQQVETVQDLLLRPKPAGLECVAVRDTPMASPQDAQHVSPSPDSVTQLLVVGGILGYELTRWADHKIDELIRRHHASDG
jgi:hypothetical protein